MYEIITVGCPDGYGFVRDYQGNKIYYGTLDECRECIGILVKTGWDFVRTEWRCSNVSD